MTISIIALFVFVFGAYAYGYLTMLFVRRGPGAATARMPMAVRQRVRRVGLAMFVTCTIWFILHATIEFRFLLGEPRENDLIDLAALELTLLFPALIFQMFLVDAIAEEQPNASARRWRVVLAALYAVGTTLAIYFPAVIFKLLPSPDPLGPYIGLSIGLMFMTTSVACLLLMQSRPTRAPTPDQMRLRRALRLLFIGMIVLFFGLTGLRQNDTMLRILDTAARSTPLFFLLVSVYFENRIEFYDLVIKRGMLLMVTLVSIAGAAAVTLGIFDALPRDAARPWLLAVLMLPVALIMPWLHDRGGRLLDRLWFGRDFTPVEAVKHVLAAMQAATDEPSLIAATESALSDIFRRRVTVLPENGANGAPADGASEVIDVRTTASTPVRFAVACDREAPMFLSEDIALLRSLGGVFGYILENVRLQHKRLEQEQLAQELRLQSSRSELKALRAQINPHFLFNALNAIASLIHTDPARADAAVEQLAEVFRYTLRRSEQEWAPLDQELSFARAYLDVEQARFGKRLDYSIGPTSAVPRAHVPSMLLQTLVENAVKHGISRLRGPGRIDIVTAVDRGRVTIEVRDTGPGPETTRERGSRAGESFGLRSVRDRLRGHFGDDASLDLRRDGDTTIARLELPLIEELSPVGGATR
jgi:hypothetical protein